MSLTIRWVIVIAVITQIVVGYNSAPLTPPVPTGTPGTPPGYEVRIHPDLPLQVGDVVSFEVYSSPGQNLEGQKLTVSLAGDPLTVLGSQNFFAAPGNLFHVTLQWIWDTKDLKPGQYSVQFSIMPAGINWEQTITLQPAPTTSPYQWAVAETDCCNVHYITGTLAEKDISRLLPEIEGQAQQVEAEMGHIVAEKIDIDLLPRVLGQGGFTANEIYLTYVGANYTDTNFIKVLHHELVHRVDADMGGDYKPLFLVEGLAVFMTGGHYRTEPLAMRSATLMRAGLFIPITNLMKNFYDWQHEIGYLEAGSLVEYMVDTWGWDAYDRFYRDIHAVSGAGDAEAVDQALQAHFGITLQMLDDRFQVFLKSFPISPDLENDVILTVQLFDTIRIFQKKQDPSAFFQQVWLPDPAEMLKRGIVADYVPRDGNPQDIAIESMLIDAGADWEKGDFSAGLQELKLILGQLQP